VAQNPVLDKHGSEQLAQLMVSTSLVDVIAHKMRENIHNGVYVPGQKLIVREIEEEMNVSQTPIKEALYRLVAEGYVEAIPRKSMVVRRVTYEQYVQNMELRAMFELFAIPVVVEARGGDSPFMAEMDEDIRVMQGVLDAPDLDYRGWLEHDGNFHKRYMKMVNNQEHLKMYAELKANRNSYFAFLDNTKHPLTKEHLRKDNVEHRQILEAIRSGSAADITDAIVGHITRPRIPRKNDPQPWLRIEQMARLLKLGAGK